ncbi:MAG: twin-arginine translocation signal domain-containing protein, partial [Cyclobacteriaceae bacterium]|nr:twin-arginine translocation signal domain-containing protein [Cyclobacteriaceae bacterium]
MKKVAIRNTSTLTRRDFMGKTALAIGGIAIVTPSVIGAPAISKNLGKPNSKFNGVQIGAISYSFRSLPNNAEQLLKYCIECNISAIELMGDTGEEFAGAPNTSTEPRIPQGPGRAGARPEPTPEEQATRQQKAKEIAIWRAAVSMDKFIQLRKMYSDAGVSIYAWKPNAL